MEDGTALPSWITLDTSTGTILIAPDDNALAVDSPYTVRVNVTDNDSNGTGEQEHAFQTFVIEVVAFNTAPTCDLRADITQEVHSGTATYTFSFADIDQPDDTLTATLQQSDGSALPSFISLDSFD